MVQFDQPSAVRIVRATKRIEKLLPAGATPYDTFMLYQFTLIEDVGSAAEVYARIETPDGEETILEGAELVNKWGVLDGAQAGYQGDCYYFKEKFYVNHGPCVVTCKSDPGTAITVPAPPVIGTVDEALTPVSVTATGDVETGSFDLNLADLPDGLTADVISETEIEITGTPTTAGTFYVPVTLQTPKLDADDVAIPGEFCTVTKVILFEIEEAAP